MSHTRRLSYTHKVDGNASISNRYQTLRDHVESYTMPTCLSSLFDSETTLRSNHNFLIESITHLLTDFLRQRASLNYIPAQHSGHFEFKTLRSPTVVGLLSEAVPQVKKLWKKIFTSRYVGGPTIFLLSPIYRERKFKISHIAKFVCPTSQLLKHPAKSVFKHVILTMPLCQHLLLTMSTIPTSVELNDSECEKGQVTQQPPIPYTVFCSVQEQSTYDDYEENCQD